MSNARLNRGSMVTNYPNTTATVNRTMSVPFIEHMTMSVPFIEHHLLDHLRSVFKTTLNPSFDIREYDRQLGQQMVIDHLQLLHDQQDGTRRP